MISLWEAMYEPQTLMASRASQSLSGLSCRCVACSVSWGLSKHRCLVVVSKNSAVPELWAAQTWKGVSNGKLKIRFPLRPTCVDIFDLVLVSQRTYNHVSSRAVLKSALGQEPCMTNNSLYTELQSLWHALWHATSPRAPQRRDDPIRRRSRNWRTSGDVEPSPSPHDIQNAEDVRDYVMIREPDIFKSSVPLPCTPKY